MTQKTIFSFQYFTLVLFSEICLFPGNFLSIVFLDSSKLVSFFLLLFSLSLSHPFLKPNFTFAVFSSLLMSISTTTTTFHALGNSWLEEKWLFYKTVQAGYSTSLHFTSLQQLNSLQSLHTQKTNFQAKKKVKMLNCQWVSQFAV